MVIVAFTYGLRPRAMFKKLLGKQPYYRKEMMERVHLYMKQDEVESEKFKTNQGEKVNLAPYTRGHIQEGTRYQVMKQTQSNRF